MQPDGDTVSLALRKKDFNGNWTVTSATFKEYANLTNFKPVQFIYSSQFDKVLVLMTYNTNCAIVHLDSVNLTALNHTEFECF
jgi:hypothetical protein